MFTFFFSSVFPYSSLSHSSQPLNTIFLYSFGSTSPSCLSLSYLSLSLGGPCPVISLALFSSFLVYSIILPSSWLPLPYLPLGSPYPSIPLYPPVLSLLWLPLFFLSLGYLFSPYPTFPFDPLIP